MEASVLPCRPPRKASAARNAPARTTSGSHRPPGARRGPRRASSCHSLRGSRSDDRCATPGAMNVDLQLIFQNYGGALPDDVHVAHERRVAELAEPLGFDKVFVVEHHFFDYAACP